MQHGPKVFFLDRLTHSPWILQLHNHAIVEVNSKMNSRSSEIEETPTCNGEGHGLRPLSIDESVCQRTAAIFRALGDPQRLRLLIMLESRSCCVSELAESLGEPLPAVSQRLRVLKSERIVSSRREGKHVFYELADGHISRLVTNGVMHAMEES